MTERKLAPRNLSQSAKQMVILLGVILLLFAIQGIMRPGSVTVGQAMNISRQASALGVVALGQALVILGGGRPNGNTAQLAESSWAAASTFP